jgi:hypothetical protein
MQHRLVLKTTLLLALLCAPLCLWGAEGKPAVHAPPATLQQPAPSAVNGITEAAVKSGVLTCAGRINQVANFLTGNSQGVGAFLFAPPVNPDQGLVSVSMEIPATSNAATAYASASFAPNQANRCDGMYETVVYWSQACAEVAQRSFSGLKQLGLLAGSLTVLDGGKSSKVFLMPAGSGCVSIKKELIQ